MQMALHSPDWVNRGGVWVRGRAFVGTFESSAGGSSESSTNGFLEGNRFADRFGIASESPDPLDSITELAASLDGFFAAVIRLDGGFVFVVDGARSIPLYYAIDGSFVSDSGRIVRNALDAPCDPVTESEFLLTRYVTGPETIWEGVYAVQPGEVVHLTSNDVSRTTYRDHWPGIPRPREETTEDDVSTVEGPRQAVDVLRGGFETALDRLETVAGDRPVVVPLSGGYDSRLLAAGLVERGREVIGFTFGRSGHPDVEVSREVAARLGIPWEFCEYDRSAWWEWYHGKNGRDYREWAFGGDALPFIAASLALRELLASGRLPRNGVYCPGHTVATPAERMPRFSGNTLSDDAFDTGCMSGGRSKTEHNHRTEVEPQIDGIVEYVLDRHYSLWPWRDDRFCQAARKRIRKGLLGQRTPSDVTDPESAAAAYERWEWRGRMSTFTNGDLRLYEDAGVDWWLPLWDPAYVRTWSRLPLERRANKRAHVALAVDVYRRVADVPASRAQLTDRTLAPVDRLLSLVRHTPARQFSERGGAWDPPFLEPRSAWDEYGFHPLAWEGIVERDGYEYLSTYADLYGMRTLAETGRIDLSCVDENFIEDGQLSLPSSGESC